MVRYRPSRVGGWCSVAVEGMGCSAIGDAARPSAGRLACVGSGDVGESVMPAGVQTGGNASAVD